MKCPVCGAEMVQDEFGYDCNNCERYFSNMAIEEGFFVRDEGDDEKVE